MSIGDEGIGSGLGIGESYVVRSKTYTLDLLLNLPSNGYYGMDAQFIKDVSIYLDLDQLVRKTIDVGIPFTAYFLHTVASYSMDTKFISDYRDRAPTDTIINTLYWSWATVLDQSYRNISTAARSMNIAKAELTDLDRIGEIYHLRRLLNETDDNYRARLMTQTNVLLGHGTKASCEAIINQAIGIEGTSIITSSPATIRIEFDNDTAARAAKAIDSTLNNIIPNMIAAGIYYDIYYNIIDYEINAAVKGFVNCPYTMDGLYQNFNDIICDISAIIVLLQSITIQSDTLIKGMVNKNYTVDNYTRKAISKYITIDCLYEKSFSKSYSMISTSLNSNITLPLYMYGYVIKNDINKILYMDSLYEISRTSRAIFDMTVV